MKLSIIVPVYNMVSDGKLEFCLNSLLNQTINGKYEYEIIAVDDASTDNSPEVLRKYEESNPGKFKVIICEKNGRQGTAKNKGLDIATGEWVSMIDSDDWVTPDFYEKLIGKAEATGADMVGCDLSRVSEHTFTVGEIVEKSGDEYVGLLDDEKHRRMILNFGYLVLKIYKREVIEKNHLRFPEGIFYEDNCAGPVWSTCFSHYEKVDEPLYFYYQHDNSTVHTITEQRCRDRMDAMTAMLEEMKNRGCLQVYHDEIEYRFTELYFLITLVSYMIGAKNKKLSFVREMKNGMLNAFPDFRNNPYYADYKETEHKKMADMLIQNDIKFFMYYRLVWWYRNLRKKK